MGTCEGQDLIVIRDGELDGKENMEKDFYLFRTLLEGKGKPTLRFYKWKKPTLSIGMHQKEEDFNLGIPVVKRPTGGRALLHGFDLSFSLIDYTERWGNSPYVVYMSIAEAIRRSFMRLGIHVSISKSRGVRNLSKFCMFAPSFGEITFNNRKLVAYATRTERGVLLAHGSLYLYIDPAEIINLIKVDITDAVISLSELNVGEEELKRIFENEFIFS